MIIKELRVVKGGMVKLWGRCTLGVEAERSGFDEGFVPKSGVDETLQGLTASLDEQALHAVGPHRMEQGGDVARRVAQDVAARIAAYPVTHVETRLVQFPGASAYEDGFVLGTALVAKDLC